MGRKRYRRNLQPMASNPNYNPTTSFAHLILVGTSGWAIKRTTSDTPVALGAFSFLLGHGILGILNFGHPSIDKLQQIYESTSMVAELFPLPLINYELYLLHNLKTELAYAHVVTAGIPLLTNLVIEEKNDKVIDILMLGNIVSLIYITLINESAWVGGLAVLTTLNHFVFNRFTKNFDVPKKAMIAISLSFFNIFAVNSLSESST